MACSHSHTDIGQAPGAECSQIESPAGSSQPTDDVLRQPGLELSITLQWATLGLTLIGLCCGLAFLLRRWWVVLDTLEEIYRILNNSYTMVRGMTFNGTWYWEVNNSEYKQFNTHWWG